MAQQQQQQIQRAVSVGAVGALAEAYKMDAVAFAQTVKATVFPNGQATNEQLAAFCIVAREYNLNPFTKQVYAFPSKGGGIVPMVSVDGWASMVNSHPQFNGMNFRYERDETGFVYGVTCIMHRKDRAHPTVVTEFLEECKGTTLPWQKAPMRMLRHRAMIQCARLAFSFSGLYDEAEAQEIVEAEVVDSGVSKPRSLNDLAGRFKAHAAATEALPEPAASESMSPEESARIDREIAAEQGQEESAPEFFGKDLARAAKRKGSQVDPG